MPNPPTHIVVAVEAARQLNSPIINENIGPYVLGSTTPDIRVITLMPREATHFTLLSSEGITTGIEALLAEYPKLADSSKLSPRTAAFMTGYFTHLIADQAWITNVYRPFFGNPKVFEDVAEANVLDRALQLDLDRQRWHVMQSVLPALDFAEQGVQIPFIDAFTLEAWREWVQGYLHRDFTWGRLRMLAGRRQHETHMDRAHMTAEEFLMSPEHGLKKLTEKVSLESVEHYRTQTMEHCLRVSREYLKCE